MSRSQAEPQWVEEDLLREIAREVVEKVAPHEVVLFPYESAAYFEDPRKALKAARKRAAAKPKDEPFGFGGGELVSIVTPIVLEMLDAALVAVGAHLMVTGVERSAGPVRAGVRRMLRRPAPAAAEEGPADVGEAEEAAPAVGAAPAPEAAAVEGPVRPAGTAEELPPALRAALWQKVYEHALSFGIDEGGSRLLADAVLGGLTGPTS
ncbi:hypothetical protein OOK31_38775 [Streptomyces sp. NBC_00249]|uniref:hypothetical protein n=1 Tax=Streptomyces sp. NBC_00249 TaxID=2975690 RepID=UPI00224D4D17|nr:hypothetical protein [Streptomyces sp. NBC_00249]MCX5199758.1 hypothetical protein [Streptomyces sp. NBC_00249]